VIPQSCRRDVQSRVSFEKGNSEEEKNHAGTCDRENNGGDIKVLFLSPVCGEFQFMRQLGSEIRRCSVAASDMTEGL
jgi:hypothetical protein